MDIPALKLIDTGVDVDDVVVSTTAWRSAVAGDTYCLHKDVGGKNWRVVRGKRPLNNGVAAGRHLPRRGAL